MFLLRIWDYKIEGCNTWVIKILLEEHTYNKGQNREFKKFSCIRMSLTPYLCLIFSLQYQINSST